MKILKRSDIIVISSNLSDDTPFYNKDTTYSKGEIVQDKKIRYKSLVDENTQALDNQVYWENLGATNDYAAFDFFLNTQAQNENFIEIVFNAKENKALYLANLWGEKVIVEVLNNLSEGEVEVVERVEAILYGGDIQNWKEYFFGDWAEKRQKDFFFQRSTAHRQVSFKIRLEAPNDTAKIGHIVCGGLRELGISMYKNTISAIDFSKIQTDGQGNTSVTKGNYKKTNSFDVAILNESLDVCVNDFIELRGEPCVFVITQEYKSLINFAILKKWEVILEKKKMAIASIELEGLV